MDTKCKVSIIGKRKFGVEKSASIRMVGEKMLDLTLYADETKNINQILVNKSEPTLITVIALKNQSSR